MKKKVSIYLFFALSLFLFFSCGILQEFDESYIGSKNEKSEKPNKGLNNYNSSNWEVTNDYRDKKDIIGHVDSWAYQKLLENAVDSKDISSIKLYLSKGANPNQRGSEFSTKLPIIGKAVIMGCYECVDAMAAKVDFNFSIRTGYHLPIVLATQHSLEMTKYLIEKYNANPNALTVAEMRSGLVSAFACISRMDHKYFRKENKDIIIRYLLNNGAKPEFGATYPITEYIRKIKMADTLTIKTFAAKGTNFNGLVSSSQSFLGQAIQFQNFEVAKVLLSNGANPNLCWESGVSHRATPLRYAIRWDNFDMVKELTDHGANVNWEHQKYCEGGSGSCLNYALKEKVDNRIIDLLLAKGAK